MQKIFQNIKNDILGKRYVLSVAYVSEKKSREINRKYRKKNKPTNVLSFALHKNEGELVLCRPLIAREAKKMKKPARAWLGFLVIHGMLHLKGLSHGAIMERLEERYLSRTKFYSSGKNRKKKARKN